MKLLLLFVVIGSTFADEVNVKVKISNFALHIFLQLSSTFFDLAEI